MANKTSINANLSTFAYGFDAVNTPQRGIRTYLDKTVGSNPTQRVNFGYDTVDQLTSEILSESGTPQWSKSFAYDPMGNRTMSQSVTSSDTVDNTYTSNKLNQVTAISASWGGGANTLASSLLYDQSGNLTKWTSTGTGTAVSAHTEYVYDDLERLIAVVKKNPTTQANLSKSEFVYDAANRLSISREYTWTDDAWVLVPESEKRRIYDGMDVIQERDDDNTVTATYTRDGNIGGILAKRDVSNDDYFFHYDGSGNVVGMTNSSQNSVAEYAYDAYGNLLSSSGAQASNNTYRYSTKEHFGSVGLYSYGYRFYSPGIGRWINRDPIGEDGGLNLYQAYINNPITYFDDYGATPRSRIGGPHEYDPGVGAGGNMKAYYRQQMYEERIKQIARQLSHEYAETLCSVGGMIRVGKAAQVVTSSIKESSFATRLANKLKETVQADVDHLINELKKGNINAGIGTRNLGKGFYEMRGRNAGRIIVKDLGNGKYDIVGKFQGHALGDAANSKIINRLIRDYQKF